MSTEPLRIVLVDDHPVVRAGLRAMLESRPELSVVGEAEDTASTLETVVRTRPDAVLMDLDLGADSGAATTAALRAGQDAPRVLVLTTYDTEADVIAALDAGADGYLLKDTPPAELYRGIAAVARGETVLAPSLQSRLVRRSSQREETLTDREVAVLGLLAQGMANKQMTRTLNVSEATVKSHLSHIYAKLGVDSRAGAVARAIEQRIIRA